MDKDKVISMLRYKFNRHYGYDVETKQENEVDYKCIVKELKELDKQMHTINKAIETKEANLEKKIMQEGEKARATACLRIPAKSPLIWYYKYN